MDTQAHPCAQALPHAPPGSALCSASTGCTRLGKVGRVKKRTRGTDPQPTVLRGSGTGLASTQGVRVKDPCPQSSIWLWPPFPCLPPSKSHCSHSFCPLLPTKPDSDFSSGVSPLLRSFQGLRVPTAWLQPSFARSSQPAGLLCIHQSPAMSPSSSVALGTQNFLSSVYLRLFGDCRCFLVYSRSSPHPNRLCQSAGPAWHVYLYPLG